MKAKEIRALSVDDIRSELEDAREEMMKLRFQQATGEMVDYTRLKQTRRLIARYLTVLKERENKVEVEGEA